MLLLRHCHVTRMNFLSRTVPPRLLESAAAIHDTLTRSTFTNLLGRGNLPDRQWLQATLPVRHGGFGLTALTSTASFAFLSSWVSTLHTIAKRIPDAERLLDEFQNSHHSNSSISRDLCNVLPQNKTLVEVINDRKQLQHKLTEEYMKSLSNGFIQNSSSTRDQSRMKSLQGKDAARSVAPDSTIIIMACIISVQFPLGILDETGMPNAFGFWSV
ncbi:uncharacterized protein LOC134187872 [Corticium candelabrum]|uniref:uncharacterized protein LOC134187872 n=1 Tax=Corticium candelabrum TaxID=121492 RepID=UPI002E25B762|nr:uncharacterized protein LOC134187872 [Corticium candelabrum]